MSKARIEWGADGFPTLVLELVPRSENLIMDMKEVASDLVADDFYLTSVVGKDNFSIIHGEWIAPIPDDVMEQLDGFLPKATTFIFTMQRLTNFAGTPGYDEWVNNE